jgi:hypothetical protein
MKLVFENLLKVRPLCGITRETVSGRNLAMFCLNSALRLESLIHNPFVKVNYEESHPRSAKFHEWNSALLHQSSDKSLGAFQVIGGSPNV